MGLFISEEPNSIGEEDGVLKSHILRDKEAPKPGDPETLDLLPAPLFSSTSEPRRLG